MPINVVNIFSKVQSAIGDLSMDLFHPGEYIETMNRLAEKVARETEIWIARHTITPNPMASAWSASTNYTNGQICENSGNYYFCDLSHTSATTFILDSAYWTQIDPWAIGTVYNQNTITYIDGPVFYRSIQSHTATADDEPPNTTYWDFYGYSGSEVYDVRLPYTFNTTELSPFRIIRVIRGSSGSYTDGVGNDLTGWNECQEYSQQAIARTISGNNSFSINNTMLGQNQFLTQFVDPIGQMDGSINLLFGGSFYLNELCVIDYISGKPFRDNPLTMWDPNAVLPVQIPDFLYDTFRWGLQWLVTEELWSRGADRFNQVSVRAKEMYRQELTDAMGYAKKLRDNNSSITIQPINWLPETEYEQ